MAQKMFQLLETSHLTVEIKKSRFIATCLPINSIDDATQKISSLCIADATHNCWAWRLGNTYRFNDDGEPGSSAGRPILAAIDGQEFDGVLAHVTRYFGGIKLGIGGLVRAYGNTVAQCLRTAPRQPLISRQTLAFRVPFGDIYAVYGLITQKNLIKTSENYTDVGLEFILSIQTDKIDALKNTLSDITCGRVAFLKDK